MRVRVRVRVQSFCLEGSEQSLPQGRRHLRLELGLEEVFVLELGLGFEGKGEGQGEGEAEGRV